MLGQLQRLLLVFEGLNGQYWPEDFFEHRRITAIRHAQQSRLVVRTAEAVDRSATFQHFGAGLA
ncbi:hypothetical protein D9M71_523390 [compost metagenome]